MNYRIVFERLDLGMFWYAEISIIKNLFALQHVQHGILLGVNLNSKNLFMRYLLYRSYAMTFRTNTNNSVSCWFSNIKSSQVLASTSWILCIQWQFWVDVIDLVLCYMSFIMNMIVESVSQWRFSLEQFWLRRWWNVHFKLSLFSTDNLVLLCFNWFWILLVLPFDGKKPFKYFYENKWLIVNYSIFE